MSLRVLQIIDKLNVGGAEKVLVDLSNLLVKKHPVTVLSILNEGELSNQLDAEIKQLFLNRKSKWNLLTASKLSGIVREYDVVHVHMRHVLNYLLFAKAIFNFKTRIIFHDHFGNIKLDKSVSRFLKNGIRKYCTYIGVSNDLVEWSREVIGLPEDQSFLLSNIIVNHTGIVYDPEREWSKFIMVSNFRKTKQIEFALDVFIELKIKYPHAMLDIYGRVVEQEYFHFIMEKIESKSLGDSVHIITNNSNILPELGQYDFALHTSKSETGPLSLIEFMSIGLPFISFNTGEVPKTVGNFCAECVIDTFEVSKWVSRIGNIRENRIEIFQKLISLFEEQFSENQYLNKCLKIYEIAKNS